jgi:hypothetical protein
MWDRQSRAAAVIDGAVVDESFRCRGSSFPTFYAMTKHRMH